MTYDYDNNVIKQHKLWVATDGKEGAICSIKDKTFTTLNIKNEDFSCLVLNNCEFTNCSFNNLNLRKIHIFHCTFTNCEIKNCNCTDIDVNDCRFFSATFKKSILVKGRFAKCSFYHTDFSNVIAFQTDIINSLSDEFTKETLINIPRSLICRYNEPAIIALFKIAKGLKNKKEDIDNETNFNA